MQRCKKRSPNYKRKMSKQLFIKIGSGKTILIQIPAHEKTTVKALKIQLQPKCRVDANNQRLTYNGKMLWDNDLLKVEPNSTLHLSHKLRGGDPFSDIVDGFTKIGDGITGVFKVVTDIFNMISNSINCTIEKFKSLPTCFVYYVISAFYYFILYLHWMAVCLISEIIYQNISLADKFLESEIKVRGYFTKILKKSNRLKKILEDAEKCFSC